MEKQNQSAASPEVNDETDSTDPSPATSSLFRFILPLFMVAGLATGGWLSYAHYKDVDRVLSSVNKSVSNIMGSEKSSEYGEFKELEKLIINPAGSNGQRYLMVTIGLESRSSKALTEVGNKEVVVRDTMLKVLGQYTVSQLSNIKNRDRTKAELLEAVNSILGGPKVDRLYFTRYVLQ